MVTLGDKNKQKQAFKFYCEKCDYGTCRKSNFDSHLSTDKHTRVTKWDKKGQKQAIISYEMLENKQDIYHEEPCVFVCICGKEYKHRQGLWRHTKKCCSISDTIAQVLIKDEMMNDKELIQYLLKENSEFKHFMLEQNKQMIELAKKAGNNNNNTTSNVVNNNQQFNLNFYLNETCKNAMNIMDFVSQLQVGIKDLEETGRLGYAEGISKIFINGLKQMSVTDRPIHCSDLKRETLYIKDNNEWNKDSEDKTILTNAIKHVSHKNIKQISEWTKLHPSFKDSLSKENDKYLKIVSESMSGTSEDESKKNYTKIIKNIVKETVIDKTVDTVTTV
jgi:hypothetical protein